MKHKPKIMAILLGMFILTQFIGLYVVDYYSPVKVVDGVVQNVTEQNKLPYGMQMPEVEKESDYYQTLFPSLVIAFVIAISLLFFLTKFKVEFVLKLWFFIVVIIALGIAINSFIPNSWKYPTIISLAIAIPLSFFKIYHRSFLVHNITELFIYPGIAAVFVPILNLWTVIALLILISIYDVWAVWHSGIMQKMAKYQMNKLKFFSGFFVPYVSKKVKLQIQKMKKSKLKEKRIKVNVAILGGGDVVFPIITAGVILKTASINLPFGLKDFVGGFYPALFVIAGATLGLAYLFVRSEKKKFYPAMPFISVGIFIGMILAYFLI
ncbi:MAG: presenilin family intramembrane aspartyl protease [Nanoarchaeota archaeon]|nr:presenilin family intramembrane aspartyl protease [Nanoarchaeota archaeon]